MKYAELPNGKVLQFSDDVSDKQMQKAVREELGLVGPRDVFKDMDRLGSQLEQLASRKPETVKLDPLLDGLKALNKAVKDLSGNLMLQNAQNGKAIDELVKAIKRTNDDIGDSTGRALSTLTQATSRLSSVITAFNGSTKEMLDHSTEAIQADLKSTARSITSLETGLKEVTALAEELRKLSNIQVNARLLRKRAYRNPDGSWTMEVIGSSHGARH